MATLWSLYLGMFGHCHDSVPEPLALNRDQYECYLMCFLEAKETLPGTTTPMALLTSDGRICSLLMGDSSSSLDVHSRS